MGQMWGFGEKMTACGFALVLLVHFSGVSSNVEFVEFVEFRGARTVDSVRGSRKFHLARVF